MSPRLPWIAALLLAACRPTSPTPVVAPPVAARVHAPDAAPAAETARPLDLVEVAPGIHAALQPAARRFRDSNAVVLVAGDDVVLVDGPQRVAATRWLSERFGLADAQHRVHLVTTHWHLDHSLAATVVGQRRASDASPVESIGHAGLATLLAAEGRQQLDERRAAVRTGLDAVREMKRTGEGPDGPLSEAERAEVDAYLTEGGAELETLQRITSLSPPTRTIAEPTTITVGTLQIEFIPVQAHTDADLVVYLPQARVLLGGDVVDELPFAGHGHPAAWRAALRQIQTRPIETIIPGHGPRLAPEHIDRMIALWTAVLGQACAAVASSRAAPEQYAEWEATDEYARLRDIWVTDAVSGRAFAAFMPEALARAVAEAAECD